MSLHAQLSPEALQRLEKQRRNSTVSSLVIALLSIVLISLVLGLFLLKPMSKEIPVIITYQAAVEETPPPEPPKKTNSPEKKPSSPSSSMAKVITSTAPSPTSVPVPDVVSESPSVEFGESVDFGSGWGSTGSGSGFETIPSGMRSRCSAEERSKRLKESGGNADCEKAVMKSLRWLKQSQNEDGSWGTQYQVAMTGFAVLAYLGHCETPQSPEFGDSVEKGIVYLVNNGMKNDGPLTVMGAKSIQWVYEHGIATYALAESTTFCNELRIKIPHLKEVTKKAGEIIMDGQSASGGWVYRYKKEGEGDNSVGFWQIQALKACKHTKIWPESKLKPTIDNALAWLEKAQGQNGAIGYRGNPTKSPQLTGGGVLAFQMWGEGESKPAKNGVEYIANTAKFDWGKGTSNLYYHYYNAQAMINAGGKEWDNYNELIRDPLVDAQNEDGTWSQKMKHGPINDHMATCLATLTLEVYYRFLPGSK